MKRTQIYLDEDQDLRVEARARAEGTTKSAVIRQAIDAYLRRGSRRAELAAVLERTAGSMPGIEVPSRSEWDRGYG